MNRTVRPAEAIFFSLANLDPDARETCLREQCGQDTMLRAEVDTLLAALEVPDDSFLNPASVPALDMAAADGPLQPGTALGDYLVLHAIGSGGMGVVYAAQQEHPRRTVAIKVLRRGFRHPEIVKRFAREAEFLGRLQHPGIAQVFAFHPGDRQTPAHLVMELVTGPPITEYVKAREMGSADRITLMIALCDAIQHAHDRSVIHRDLKPANVLISDAGQPKVLDFGIARATGLDVQSTLQTAHGQLLGTVAYMSPEQLRGAIKEVDHRSDLYALGVMFYRLMSGRLPVDVTGLSLVEAAQRLLNVSAPPLGQLDPSLAGPIEQVAAVAMSVDPAGRYQSASDMGADLRACLDGSQLAANNTTLLHAGRVITVESGDRRLVAIGFASGRVVVLDAASGKQLANHPGDGTPLERLLFEPDDTLAVTRGSGPQRITPGN